MPKREIALGFNLWLTCGMAAAVEVTKKRKYSRGDLEAADRLLKAVKEKMLRDEGKIDEEALRKDGYSEQLISRLKEI